MRILAVLVLVLATTAAPAVASAPFQRGFVLTGWKPGTYLTPGSDAAIHRMGAGGSDHVAVFSQWFLDTPTSSRITPDAAKSPTDAAVLHAMATARAAGMQVTVKPQIGIRAGGWIGGAHPADPEAFWAGYRTMLLHYADLAEQGGARMLVVGTEMATISSSEEPRWRALIAEARAHFHGELTYAANYDEFQRVPFWDALDYIGIDAYFPLADEDAPPPGAPALASAWSARGHLAAIEAVSRRTGKRVIFTELGYRGTRSTAVHPQAWSVRDVTDTAAQANAYEAFYNALAGEPWMAGVYWWEVSPDSWWVQDFNPIGKPAEQVVAAWNRRMTPVLEPLFAVR